VASTVVPSLMILQASTLASAKPTVVPNVILPQRQATSDSYAMTPLQIRAVQQYMAAHPCVVVVPIRAQSACMSQVVAT